MPEYSAIEDIRRILNEARTVAILGAHPEQTRPANYVPAYLYANGYRVLPVNPGRVGVSLWGERVRASLTELEEPVDIVDVFRRSGALMGHLDEILGMNPRPKLVWLQLGIRNDAFARALVDAGIDVVQDRCTLADHRALFGS